jgi:23S rRNA pseudouridine1911/1915/1917 synthase
MAALFEILHEDAGLLVLNKPAGLVCHPTKNGEMSSLIGRVRLYLGNQMSREGREGCEEYPDASSKPSTLNLKPATSHLVNRLDRETSGVTVVAKNSEAAGGLGKIWESRAVEKEYLAIVHGHVRGEHGVIDAPLGRDARSLVAVKDCVCAGGAAAVTEFFVEKRFARVQGDFSLLRVLPRSGRKHQIRIHLAHLGHPVVGDKLYGGDEDLYLALVEDRLTPEQRARLIFENHALHARRLRFEWRGAPREFSCEPEDWFRSF